MEVKNNQCPEFPFFGATYPDATCIEGRLWDLDKYENGKLYGGGEHPCPFCNTEEFIQDLKDNDVTDEQIEGYMKFLNEKYNSPKIQ